MRVATGHRIAEVARRMGVYPIAPNRIVPDDTWAVIAPNGDVYDIADIFEALETRLGSLENRVGTERVDLEKYMR